MQKLGHFFFNKIKIFKKGAYQPMNMKLHILVLERQLTAIFF